MYRFNPTTSVRARRKITKILSPAEWRRKAPGGPPGLAIRLGVLVAALIPCSYFCRSFADAQDRVVPTSIPARTWAEQCATNEILVIEHPESYLHYRFHEVDEKGDQVRDQIETRDGSVGRLIQRDGRPLTPEEDAAERERLKYLVDTPSAFFHHIKNEQANKKLGVDLLNMMGDAMIWSYTPGQPQLPEHPSAEPPLIVLDFKPNPKWSPPSIAAEALTGLEGRIWIDSQTRQMVRLEGDIFHAVNIGWGMVAHIFPGGTVTLQQTNTGGQRWIVNHIVEQITVRALMVKTIKQKLVYDSTDFQTISPMTYQQAIKILLDTPLPSH